MRGGAGQPATEHLPEDSDHSLGLITEQALGFSEKGTGTVDRELGSQSGFGQG